MTGRLAQAREAVADDVTRGTNAPWRGPWVRGECGGVEHKR